MTEGSAFGMNQGSSDFLSLWSEDNFAWIPEGDVSTGLSNSGSNMLYNNVFNIL